MPWFQADLHIHSCLSPCGDLRSSPQAIVHAASKAGLDLIALTDHNSSLNCPTFSRCAQKNGLSALFGMEATSAEEAHCLCLFGELDTALEFSALAYEHLANIHNNPDRFGDQVWVEDDETIGGEVDKWLVGALDLGLTDLCTEVQKRGGLVIPAHVDRSAMSLLSQLGRVPTGNWDALELLLSGTRPIKLGYTPLVASTTMPTGALEELLSLLSRNQLKPGLAWNDTLLSGKIAGLPLLANSDAHQPEDIGLRRTLFWAEHPDFPGLRSAIASGLALGAWPLSSR